MYPEDFVNDQLMQLQVQYRKRLEAVFEEMKQQIEQLDGAALSLENTRELYQSLHKLAGSAGSFGYDVISDQVILLHRTLGNWRQQSCQGVEKGDWIDFASRVLSLPALLLPEISVEEATLLTVGPALISSEGDIVIWVVEDDVFQGDYLTHQLQAYGYAAQHFLTLSEAEAACQNQRPDLLILDVVFEAEGQNATQVLLDSSPLVHLGCPLIFISAHDSFDSRMRAARLGAEGYFVKPLDIVRLANRVGYLIEAGTRSPERVLIVDDDLILARHYQLILQQAGMQVEVLINPRKIVETIAGFRPDLILMDLYMPGYSGPELAAMLRQYDHLTSLSIVYLSAESDQTLQIEAMRNRADDFIMKPVAEQQLVSAVRVRVARTRELNNLIVKDGLTGLLRHVSVKDAAAAEVARSVRTLKPVSLVMIDIDHFKLVNDTYGHAVGDLVISSAALLLKQRLRQTDIIGRYGGEEFLVILPDCDAEAAFQVVDALREAFSAIPFTHEAGSFTCTFSAGISVKADYGDQCADLLLERADLMLYRSKNRGRNCVTLDDSH